MSSIPLPALGLKPPPQPDMMGDMAKMMHLKSMQQGQQEGALDLQQKQRQMQDQQTIMQVAQAHGGSLLSALPELAGKISAASFIPLQKSIIDTQKSYAEKDKLDLENEKSRADQLLGVITQAKQLPPDQYQQMFPQIAAKAVEIEPRLKNQINPQQPIPQQMLDNVALGFATHSQLATIETQKREAATAQATILKDTAQAGSANAEAANKTAEAEYYKKNGGAPGVPTEAVQMNDWLRKNPGKSPSDFMKYKATLVPVTTFNLQNAGAGPQANGQPSAMAQAVASGTMKWQDVISPRTPMSVKNQFAEEVKAINPNFDTSTFGIEQKAAEKATSGSWADTRVAYNTAIDHANQLLTAADALKNGDVQKLNSLKNYFSTQFGSPDVTNFSAIANAYNHEVTSVVAKGHMTDAEVSAGHATLPDNASPAQIRGVAAAYKNLMESKRDELDKVIKAGAGKKADGVLGVQSNTSQSTAVTKTYQGHTYTQQPDGSWKLQ